MEIRLTTEELASNLTDVLDRVRGGERFVIECDCNEIAVLAPPVPQPGVTGRELADALRNVPRPDDTFAEDLEAIHNAQGVIGTAR